MPSQIGYPLFLLFLLGLGGSLLRKKDPLVALCLVWFFLGYLFYSGEVTARRLSWGIPRYALTLYGPVAILMADLLGRFVERVGVFGGRLTIGILLVSLLLVSTVIPMWPVETRYTTFLQRRQSTYASYEEAIPFMMKTLPQGSRIFDTRGSNYFKFYVGKYRPSLVWNKEESEAIQYEPRNSQQELLLYQKCRRESFDYVFCESGGLSKNRFALLRVFENKETKRCLWKVL